MAAEVTTDTFEELVLHSDIPVLVDFWAPWCAPCRLVGPIIDTLAEEYQGRVKILKCNIQEDQQVAVKYGVRSIPTVTLFKGGEPAGSLIGARSKSDYEDLLKKAEQ